MSAQEGAYCLHEYNPTLLLPPLSFHVDKVTPTVAELAEALADPAPDVAACVARYLRAFAHVFSHEVILEKIVARLLSDDISPINSGRALP